MFTEFNSEFIQAIYKIRLRKVQKHLYKDKRKIKFCNTHQNIAQTQLMLS